MAKKTTRTGQDISFDALADLLGGDGTVGSVLGGYDENALSSQLDSIENTPTNPLIQQLLADQMATGGRPSDEVGDDMLSSLQRVGMAKEARGSEDDLMQLMSGNMEAAQQGMDAGVMELDPELLSRGDPWPYRATGEDASQGSSYTNSPSPSRPSEEIIENVLEAYKREGLPIPEGLEQEEGDRSQSYIDADYFHPVMNPRGTRGRVEPTGEAMIDPFSSDPDIAAWAQKAEFLTNTGASDEEMQEHLKTHPQFWPEHKQWQRDEATASRGRVEALQKEYGKISDLPFDANHRDKLRASSERSRYQQAIKHHQQQAEKYNTLADSDRGEEISGAFGDYMKSQASFDKFSLALGKGADWFVDNMLGGVSPTWHKTQPAPQGVGVGSSGTNVSANSSAPITGGTFNPQAQAPQQQPTPSAPAQQMGPPNPAQQMGPPAAGPLPAPHVQPGPVRPGGQAPLTPPPGAVTQPASDLTNQSPTPSNQAAGWDPPRSWDSSLPPGDRAGTPRHGTTALADLLAQRQSQQTSTGMRKVMQEAPFDFSWLANIE